MPGLSFGLGLGLNPRKGVPFGALVLDGVPLLLDGGYLILSGS